MNNILTYLYTYINIRKYALSAVQYEYKYKYICNEGIFKTVKLITNSMYILTIYHLCANNTIRGKPMAA